MYSICSTYCEKFVSGRKKFGKNCWFSRMFILDHIYVCSPNNIKKSKIEKFLDRNFYCSTYRMYVYMVLILYATKYRYFSISDWFYSRERTATQLTRWWTESPLGCTPSAEQLPPIGPGGATPLVVPQADLPRRRRTRQEWTVWGSWGQRAKGELALYG